jgi:predicted nucleotidyltransferase
MSFAPNLGANAPNMGATPGRGLLAAALFGKTRGAVLGLCLGHPHERFYMRQMARVLGVGQGALQRELRNLTTAGILLRETQGRQIYYRANEACPIFADLQGLLCKTVGLGDLLRAALAPYAEKIRVAFVYGSMAKGTAQAGSDVDVMIVGEATFAEIASALNPTQDALRREVNASVYPAEELWQRIRSGNHFMATVLAEPKLFLIGDQSVVDRLVAEGLAS